MVSRLRALGVEALNPKDHGSGVRMLCKALAFLPPAGSELVLAYLNPGACIRGLGYRVFVGLIDCQN